MFGFPDVRAFTPDRCLEQGDRVRFGNVEMDVLHCLGHTPGMAFFNPGRLAIVGDVLFKGSVGRTDFPHGRFRYADRPDPAVARPLGTTWPSFRARADVHARRGGAAIPTAAIERSSQGVVVRRSASHLPTADRGCRHGQRAGRSPGFSESSPETTFTGAVRCANFEARIRRHLSAGEENALAHRLSAGRVPGVRARGSALRGSGMDQPAGRRYHHPYPASVRPIAARVAAAISNGPP